MNNPNSESWTSHSLHLIGNDKMSPQSQHFQKKKEIVPTGLAPPEHIHTYWCVKYVVCFFLRGCCYCFTNPSSCFAFLKFPYGWFDFFSLSVRASKAVAPYSTVWSVFPGGHLCLGPDKWGCISPGATVWFKGNLWWVIFPTMSVQPTEVGTHNTDSLTNQDAAGKVWGRGWSRTEHL